jgi:hypothetical protein
MEVSIVMEVKPWGQRFGFGLRQSVLTLHIMALKLIGYGKADF